MTFEWLYLSSDPLAPALLVSLLSVGVLVGLFFYLNVYTKRDYFTIWGTAWLFYALWLTLKIGTRNAAPDSIPMLLNRCCLATSAAFLLWGSLRFMGMTTHQKLIGLFLAFLYTWSYVSAKLLADVFFIRVALFFFLGLASLSAAIGFFRLRRSRQFVGASLLAMGFFLWSVYLGSYPFYQRDESVITWNLFLAASLQLFIAVSMIILVLEEVRDHGAQVREEIREMRCEKEALQLRIVSAEAQIRSMFEESSSRGDMQKIYDDLRQTQQMVVQQERLRAVGEMASGIAHDINNSLTPIIGYSSLLLEDPTITSSRRKYLESIKTAAGDIGAMIARMRQFYRRRSPEEASEPLDLNAIVSEVIEMTRPRWRDIPQREGVLIEIGTDLEQPLPKVSMNASEIREALTNLVVNAVDAMPKGGKITIATRLANLPSVEAGSSSERVVLEVRDTGSGMDEVTRQRCLEPFFTTKGPRGTGLGLSMVYGMARRSHALLEIDSAAGKGTTVRLSFAPTACAEAKRPAQASTRSGLPLRILCIDDDERVSSLLHDFLARLDHVVEVADDPAKALKRFRDSAGSGKPFQVVITDLGMPVIDGREVARRVKEEAPQTRVIMLTGWAGFMDGDDKLPSNVDMLLSKPLRLDVLKDLLANISLGRMPMPALAAAA